MNASELQAGQELDALVAERVMGLHVEWRKGVPLWVGNDLPGSPYVLEDGLFGHSIDRYSKDIASAWEVYIKAFGNRNDICLRKRYDEWCVDRHWFDDGHETIASAPAVELAI